jgi:PTH1 family peptidyl-tRNA hydrolase
MKLLVGLGNPGNAYAETRHNIGFMVVDLLAKTFPVSLCQNTQWFHLRRITLHHQHLFLIQPQTYMNRSGLAVEQVLRHYQGLSEHLVVIYDDLDLQLGRLRIRPRGGHGGHKGVKSLIEHLGTQEFIRIRIGIGRPRPEQSRQASRLREEVVDYVLQPFQPDELTIVNDVMTRAIKAIDLIVHNQLARAMNLYNRSEFQESDSPEA